MKELFDAVRESDLARVQALVEADPSLAIFAAAILGDTEKLTAMLTANRSLIGLMSTDGWTLLHLTAYFGKTDATRLLLNKGALVNARSTNSLTNMPLHAAASGRHAEVAKLLIEHGAPVDARQHGGWAPVHAAALNGDIELAKVLVAAGADVNVRAENNQNALDLALSKGHQAMVEYLESNGAKL